MNESILGKIGFAVLCYAAIAVAPPSLFSPYVFDINNKAVQASLETPREFTEPTIPITAGNTQPNSETKSDSKNMPDDELFDMFLVRVVALRKAAETAQTSGKSGKLWSNYLQSKWIYR